MPTNAQEKDAKKEKKETLSAPKGMRDLLGDEYYTYQGFAEKAAEVAVYYGFKPIETPILERIEVFERSQGQGTDIIEKEMYTLRTKGGTRLAMRPEGTAGIMRAYLEHGMNSQPQPILLYHYGPFFRHENPQRGRLRELRQFSVEILGTPKSIADTIVIKTLLAIFVEAGLKNILLEINSIGDRECRPRYVRELSSYYRKHINALCADCRERIKTNPLRMLDCKNPKCQPLKEKAPESMSYLCNECRQHFKEVLEYLETLAIPYTINPHLVRGLDYYTKTVFEIFEIPEAQEPSAGQQENAGTAPAATAAEEYGRTRLALGSGGRYDNLARSLGSRKDIAGVGGAIGVDRLIASPSFKRIDPRIVRKAKVYFIQLGFEAKLKSLSVIEILRKAKVPIMQSLAKDNLSAQLAHAERTGIPYTIIFGQKEALEGTVIVRDMSTRSQDSVKIADLPEYLKKIK